MASSVMDHVAFAMKYRKELPKLPKSAGRKVSNGILNGLVGRRSNRFQLIDQAETGTYSWGSKDHMHVLDPQVDFSSINTVRRRLMTFGRDFGNDKFKRSINKELAGDGESNPLLSTFLGLAMSAVGGGAAGLVYTGFTTALAFAPKNSQPIRVRDGDEIHHIELIGTNGFQIKHVELLVLIDPYRVQANRDIKQWIIHDKRRTVTFQSD